MKIADPSGFRSSTREKMREAARTDLYRFMEMMLPAVEPAQTFIDARHMRAIAHALMRLERGEIRRLLIAVPPRHQKSYAGSVCFPAWILGRAPNSKILCGSYGETLAVNELGRRSRAVLTSQLYRGVFPKTRLIQGGNSLDELRTTAGGYRLATTVGGPSTGQGADYVIVDDPMKYIDASSETARDKVYDWIKRGLISRFDTPSASKAVVIMQRLHNDDAIGRLVDDGGWELLCLPGEISVPTKIDIGKSKPWLLQPGDLLFPERFDRAALDQQRRDYGEAAYNAMVLQRPSPPGGSIIKLEWLEHYNPKKLDHSKTEMVIQSWDTAETTSASSDYSVCTTWAIRDEYFILLDIFRERLPYHKLLQAVVDQKKKWNAPLVIIENAGTGRTIYQQLRDVLGFTWIHKITPRESKVLRAERHTPKLEQRRVYIPGCNAPWANAFEAELAQFPYGKHDDQVDSMTQLFDMFDVVGPMHPAIQHLRYMRKLAANKFGLAA